MLTFDATIEHHDHYTPPAGRHSLKEGECIIDFVGSASTLVHKVRRFCECEGGITGAFSELYGSIRFFFFLSPEKKQANEGVKSPLQPLLVIVFFSTRYRQSNRRSAWQTAHRIRTGNQYDERLSPREIVKMAVWMKEWPDYWKLQLRSCGA